jgi:glycosyltransferase involved in cell wall biosynthesis
MASPLVTVSSAFYNTGPLILDMIRSVFAQTFTDWELLLINDGSTDNTLEIVQSVNDPRIRVYSNECNRGRAFSLNRITELACGKYIARMDSDDICSPTRIEKQVALLESDPQLDAVSTGLIYLDKQDNPIGDMICPTDHENICATPWRTFHFAHGAMMARKEYFMNTPYREDIPMAVDFNMFLRSHQYSRFGNVPEPLYYYRLDNSFNLKKQFTARKYSASFLYDYYKQHGDLSSAIQYAANQYLKFIVTLILFASGQRKRLMAKRFKTLDCATLNMYQDEIRFIKSFQLPLNTENP